MKFKGNGTFTLQYIYYDSIESDLYRYCKTSPPTPTQVITKLFIELSRDEIV